MYDVVSFIPMPYLGMLQQLFTDDVEKYTSLKWQMVSGYNPYTTNTSVTTLIVIKVMLELSNVC